MKDLSFFLLKNALGAKMKKAGFRNSCSGDDSTSTVNQKQQQRTEQGPVAGSCSSSTCNNFNDGRAPYPNYSHPAGSSSSSCPRENYQPTLEDMILQLEMEERAARRARLDQEYGGGEVRHRMSCVNSSDILRSARNALNQYPRFSLDGKDAMYRSSFRNMNMIPAAAAINNQQQGQGFRKVLIQNNPTDLEIEKIRQLPTTLAGETVVWCRPGVIGKLMGLDAIPIPIGRYRRRDSFGLTSVMKRHNLRWREENEKRDEIEMIRSMTPDTKNWVRFEKNKEGRGGGARGSCSTTGYCVMKPVKIDHGSSREEGGWPVRHFQ